MYNKIQIHPSCYFFLIISVITGNFTTVFLCGLLLLGHECGHFFTAMLFNWPTEKIVFYPFGGIAKFQADINRPLKEELLVLLMGPFLQCILFSVFKIIPFINYHDELLTTIHYNILFFNLLPIYPLDGGRILQCISCYFISYYASFWFIYIISYFLICCLCFMLLLYPNVNLLLIIVVLLLRIVSEQGKTKFYMEKFLLERYLHHYHFKKKKIVCSEKSFKRDYQHLLRQNQHYILEEDYLRQKYILK